MEGTENAPTSRVEATLARAHAFTEKLLAENARLRQMLAATHAGAVPRPAAPGAADSARVRELEHQLADAREALARQGAAGTAGAARAVETEVELAELRRRHAELAEQNNSLANLYVASYQLHSTLDLKEVIAIVMEIVVNLVGAEVFSILLVDGKTNELSAIAAEGLPDARNERIKVGEGIVGEAAQAGTAYYRPPQDPGPVDSRHPLAAIPLKIKDHVIGVITVLGLFPQKSGFSSTDYELFDLLAGHAATAIYSAKLYSESERKLATIQSFLDLLTTS